MASHYLKCAIVKHLSAQSDSWSSTVSKVQEITGMGRMFIEDAMKHLVEDGHVIRAADGGTPAYIPAGNIDGKYDDFNEKRLDAPSVRVDNTYGDKSPWKKSIGDKEAV